MQNEPRWDYLITPPLKRMVVRALPSHLRKKHSQEVCELILKHWLFTKKMVVDADGRNRYGVKEHNTVEIDPKLLEISPTFDEFVDALCTICKLKSGGVWDIDQKCELLVGVYGKEKKGSLTRDEFAEILRKHSMVKPPPAPPTFETEEEQIEYERKVKRGEIKIEKVRAKDERVRGAQRRSACTTLATRFARFSL